MQEVNQKGGTLHQDHVESQKFRNVRHLGSTLPSGKVLVSPVPWLLPLASRSGKGDAAVPSRWDSCGLYILVMVAGLHESDMSPGRGPQSTDCGRQARWSCAQMEEDGGAEEGPHLHGSSTRSDQPHPLLLFPLLLSLSSSP